jgi:hypothetical protein
MSDNKKQIPTVKEYLENNKIEDVLNFLSNFINFGNDQTKEFILDNFLPNTYDKKIVN